MTIVDCQFVRVTPIGDDGYHYFYGYYDKNPWDSSENRLLAHRVTFGDRFPKPCDSAEIGYILLDGESQFVKIGESTAWNWQQGAQLQWLRHENTGEEQVIFNKRLKDKLVAIILRLDSREQHTIDTPVYTVSPSGKYALSLNYARLFDTRMDYGIAGLRDLYEDHSCPEDDGIYRVDLETGESKLIISIAKVFDFERSPAGRGAKHWVNHMMFNPSGTRFCFLHRFWRSDGIMQSRLFAVDSDGANLRLLFEGMASHYCWRDDTTILAWAGKRNILGISKTKSGTFLAIARRCLKPIYYAVGKPRILMQKIVGDSFYLIEDSGDGSIDRFAYGQLTTDGHCSISSDGRWILTDGYTDSKNHLPLFLYDTYEEKIIEIGRFPTPKALEGPLRVDLHPRFNRDGTKVCIDSAMDGTRQIYVVDVSAVVKV